MRNKTAAFAFVAGLFLLILSIAEGSGPKPMSQPVEPSQPLDPPPPTALALPEDSPVHYECECKCSDAPSWAEYGANAIYLMLMVPFATTIIQPQLSRLIRRG